jgi:FlaA1/EpsC-like NDP-sugar epimerase
MIKIDRLIVPALALPRIVKRGIVIAVDVALCLLTVSLAFYLRLGEWVPLSLTPMKAAFAAPVIAIPIFIAFGLYRAVFRYVSWEALTSIAQAVLVFGLIYASIFTAFGVTGIPRTIGIIEPILLLIAVGSSRAFGRYLFGHQYRKRLRRGDCRNVLIFGAGAAGRELRAGLADSADMRVVGFIDEDPNLQGNVVSGVPVWGPQRLAAAVEQLSVDEVLLAIPSTSRRRRNDIVELVRGAGVAVRTLPGLLDLVSGKVMVSDLRPLEVEDLLGRDAVAPDEALLNKNIRGKVVLVTGAGGSIGSELCRQIAALGPAKLLLVEMNEFALYDIHRELRKTRGDAVELIPLLASACDSVRIRKIFATWRPDTVYHAAAYKHVPLVEHNVVEGVRNNVIGTWTCATAAGELGIPHFVLISTDKAVRPTNVMGASKRLAEMVLQALARQTTTTCFAMVRFGNVLDSSGSVVPLFREQIANGGPVTVTHREVTRYFMTIPEAAQLVMQAGAMAKGGEVFVLDMGDPVKILDLAIKMIEVAGQKRRTESNPDGDIEITFSGLRPGEKLYEELLIGNDPAATTHPRVMMANEGFLPMDQLEAPLVRLRKTLEKQDAEAVREQLLALVPDFTPSSESVDWLSRAPTQSDTDGADAWRQGGVVGVAE